MTLVNGGITVLKITGKTNNYLSPFKNTDTTSETNRKKEKNTGTVVSTQTVWQKITYFIPDWPIDL